MLYNFLKFIVALILSLGLVAGAGYAVAADSGSPPSLAQISGNVTINGVKAGAGVQVIIKTGNTQVASTPTDSQGRYGYNPIVKVSAASGSTLSFYVNGNLCPQTTLFTPGATLKLDLVSVSPPTPPPAVTKPAAQQTPTQNQTNTQAPVQPTATQQPLTFSQIINSPWTFGGIGLVIGILLGIMIMAFRRRNYY